jgi:hypothetical protein
LIQSFANKTTADLFREENTRVARRVPQEIWRIVQRKLKLLDGGLSQSIETAQIVLPVCDEVPEHPPMS